MDLGALLALVPAVLDLLKEFGPLGLTVFVLMVGANKIQMSAPIRSVLPLVLGVLVDAVWKFTHGTPLNQETIVEVVRMGFGGGVTSTTSYQIIKHVAEKYPKWVGPILLFVK